MTNYNERLDEILERHGMYAVLKDENRFDDAAMEREFPAEVGPDKTKQAISSLTKELVAEAKPMVASKEVIETYLQNGMTQKAAEYHGRNHAIDQFEQNLLKELEEVK